jgi:hypothetical protein
LTCGRRKGKGKVFFFKILFFHCGMARGQGELERVFFINMLKGGREGVYFLC